MANQHGSPFMLENVFMVVVAVAAVATAIMTAVRGAWVAFAATVVVSVVCAVVFLAAVAERPDVSTAANNDG